ncbi:sodium-dependent transporter [candidate division KSB1 bacterium]|nr:sodium-dependent transporter [candidate division KSB1 bacterium]
MLRRRGKWGSQLGFILAAAGSAVGLGNIWRFPYMTGENGGAPFVFIYILCVIIIGLPILLAELAIGRHTEKNPVGAFKNLAPRSGWFLVGLLGVATGIGILSYYAVIAGWTVGYFFKTVTGAFSTQLTAEDSKIIFETFVSNPGLVMLCLFVFIVMTAYVVRGGVSKGIERWSKILMPTLFIMLVLLTIRSVTLPGAVDGLRFYLQPDFSEITLTTFAKALGQAMFSMSLGMGAMITYGSYIGKKESLPSSAAWVCFSDLSVALISGLMIFPALFAMNISPEEGPGLVFVVLPTIFARIPGGLFFGTGFFLLLSVAALTSTISLLEVVVAFLVDQYRWSRTKAVVSMSALAFFVGIPSALSLGASTWLSNIPFVNRGFLDLFNIILGNYSLIIGSFLIALFVSYKWGIRAVVAEVRRENNIFYFRRTWAFLIRYITPIAILAIFVYIMITGNYF